MKLVYLASHPIQYQAPLFRALAERCEFEAWFAHRQDAEGQAAAGYGQRFHWDVDLLDGYRHAFLDNVAARPAVSTFGGCDTPGVGARLAALRPDALVVGGWNLKAYWQARAAAHRLRIPVHARTDSQEMPGDGLLRLAARQVVHRIALRGFDGFLAAGERSVDYLRALGIAARKISVVPHTIDVPRFVSARALRDDLRRQLDVGPRVVFAFVGRLVPMKRVDLLVDALASLPADSALLWVVGDGPLRDDLARRAAGLPVRFLGFRNQSEIPGLLAAADVLVLPSERDTWGLVVNEMIAVGGRALVSASAGCGPDLSRFGPIVRVFDPGGLAATLADVHADTRDGTDRSAVDAARERALAWFEPAASADALLRAVAGGATR